MGVAFFRGNGIICITGSTEKLGGDTRVTKIYLDVCCLNRPFDDQTQARIRLEAEAILMILAQCETGHWEWIGSELV